MTNLPELTKMNWSSKQPTFEELKGKTVYCQYADGSYGYPTLIDSISKYKDVVADSGFLSTLKKFAILDLSEPLEAQDASILGCKVYIVQNSPDNHFQWGFASKNDAIELAKQIDLLFQRIAK